VRRIALGPARHGGFAADVSCHTCPGPVLLMPVQSHAEGLGLLVETVLVSGYASSCAAEEDGLCSCWAALCWDAMANGNERSHRCQPDDSTYKEILRELAFAQMIYRGLEDSRAWRTVANEEIRAGSAHGRDSLDRPSGEVAQGHPQLHQAFAGRGT